MNYIINIFFFLILCIDNINANNNVINILIGNSEIRDKNYLENYNKLINDYLISKGSTKYKLNFSYCKPDENDGINLEQNSYTVIHHLDFEYSKNFNCTIRALKGTEYDMLVLDNDFLYSDDAYQVHVVLNGSYRIFKLTEYYLDYKDFNIKNENLSHHDNYILEEGYYKKKHLYGIPYEVDFNLLYCHEEYNTLKDSLSFKTSNSSNISNPNGYGIKNVVNNDVNNGINNDKNNDINNGIDNGIDNGINDDIDNGIYNGMANENNPDDPLTSNDGLLSMGLGDNDEMLYLFAEFLNSEYDLGEKTPENYEIFYKNITKEVILEPFKNYIINYAGQKIGSTFDTSLRQAFTSFENKSKPLFKGRASYFKTFRDNPNINVLPTSLPNNRSIFQRKYLVINNHSKIDKNDLVDMAFELTSPDIQLFRAENFGNIPTFNIKDELNSYVNRYCEQYPEICSVYKEIVPIRIDNFYKKDEKSASYMETRLFLPHYLKNGLSNLTKYNTDKFDFVITNLLGNQNEDLSFIEMLKYLAPVYINLFLILVIVIVIIFVLKYRKHPYLKAISPILVCLNLTGYIFNFSQMILVMLCPNDFMCYFSFIYRVVAINLIYLPMIAIIYRLYYIYSNISKVNYGGKVNDKRLIKYILISLVVMVLGIYIITYSDNFALGTFGVYSYVRFNICAYTKYMKYAIVFTLYSTLMVRNKLIFFFFFLN